MFLDSRFETLDLSGWVTSSAINMTSMFYAAGSESLDFNLDVTSFDTTNVTDISFMFNKCSSLEELDMTSFEFVIPICRTRSWY